MTLEEEKRGSRIKLNTDTLADHIDVKAAAAKGIKIGHTPGVLTAAVSDICVMLVLMTMRRVEEGIALVKSGGWPEVPWSPFVMCGPSISHPGLTLSFLGFGRISQETLRKLLVFTNQDQKPRVQYTSSKARPNQKEIDQEFSQQFGVTVERVEKDELAANADILVVLCDLNPSTKDAVNKEFLQKMKKSAVLVNGARVSYHFLPACLCAPADCQGPVVNSDHLADALEQGEIFGAGLDVITGEPNVGPENRLVQLKNCKWFLYVDRSSRSKQGIGAYVTGVVIPHMGSADVDTRKKMAELCE